MPRVSYVQTIGTTKNKQTIGGISKTNLHRVAETFFGNNLLKIIQDNDNKRFDVYLVNTPDLLEDNVDAFKGTFRDGIIRIIRLNP